MKSALVVYESLFGDAHTIAHAIAEGLSARMPTLVMDARDAPGHLGPEVGLLVVGGPTHQFGMPRQRSRDEAVRTLHAELPSTTSGLREWLSELSDGHGRPAVAFDTRLTHPVFLKFADHASRQAEELLREHGFAVVATSRHFYVTGTTGPLKDGEEERARAWGRALAETVGMEPSGVA